MDTIKMKYKILLTKNREEIICETFRNKNNLYKNYCNPNQLFKDKQECCRLNGYYIDMLKRKIDFIFDKSNYVEMIFQN